MAILGGMSALAIRHELTVLRSLAHFHATQKAAKPSQGDEKHPSIGLVKILQGKPTFQSLPVPTYTLEKGVIEYGNTKVSADKITLWPGDLDKNPSSGGGFQGKGEAIGNVEVIGPSFSLHCLRFTFDWSSKSGTSLQPKIIIPNLDISASQGEFTNNTFTFDDAVVSQTGVMKGLGVRAKKLQIKPDDYILAEHGAVLSGQQSSYGFARYRINLTQDQGGLHLPYPSYSSQYGFGLTLNSMIHLGPTSSFNFGMGSVQKALPFYNLQFNQYGADDSPKNFHTLETVFDERFSQSYFDDIESRDPADRFDLDSAHRNRASIGTFWNEEPNDRITTDSYFSPIQIGYEGSQRFGSLGVRAATIFQDVGFSGHQAIDRGVGLQSASLKPIFIKDNFSIVNQLDAAEYFGSTQYGWGRFLSGLAWTPSAQISLSGGLYGSVVAGTPQFPMDELYSRSGMMVRMDTHFKTRTFSVLFKYDFGTTRWYDTEFYFSQVAGLYEPYIVYRTFPSALKFGIKLRFNSILNGVFKDQEKSAPRITSYKL